MDKRINVLELRSIHQFIPAKGFDTEIELLKLKKDDAFNYNISTNTSLSSNWWEHLALNETILKKSLSLPEIHFLLASYKGEIVGAFDLLILPDKAIEIKNFGITANYVHFKIRALVLSKAVDYCFQFNPSRIFYQTSEFDKMAAISNYLSQGFTISAHNQGQYTNQITEEKSYLVSKYLINHN